MQSLLALTYSDQSVLERHHLASAFAVLKTKGYDILSGLSSDDYRTVRSLIIEFVLATDLTTHFDFIVRLKTIAATRGHASFAASQAAAAQEAMHRNTGLARSDTHSHGGRRSSIDLANGAGVPSGICRKLSSVGMAEMGADSSAGTLGKPRGFRAGSMTEAAHASPLGALPGIKQRPTAMQRRKSHSAEAPGPIGTAEQRRGSHTSIFDRRGSKRPSDAGHGVPEGGGTQQFVPAQWVSPFADEEVDVRLVLTTAVKFADLNHAAKPLALHRDWSYRITTEFWALGDKEKKLGATISPLCDRVADKDIAKSQVGFFQFVCLPFFEQVADLVDPDMIPFMTLKQNCQSWKDEAAQLAAAAAAAANAPPA